MADVNRHVKWEQWPAKVRIRGGTVLDKGDLLFFDRVAGLRHNGNSTATYSAFPFNYIGGTTKTLASNQQLAADNFLGVAMYDSDSGVTEEIAVATAGLYKYPFKSAKKTNLGSVIMPEGSGTSIYSQVVSVWQSGSTYAIGHCQRARAKSGEVEFRLRPVVAAIGNEIS